MQNSEEHYNAWKSGYECGFQHGLKHARMERLTEEMEWIGKAINKHLSDISATSQNSDAENLEPSGAAISTPDSETDSQVM